MLTRVLGRSIQSPALRAVSASSRIAASAQWSRGLASNNKNRNKKDWSKPSNSQNNARPPTPSSSKAGGPAAAAFGAPRSSPSQPSSTHFSNTQEEVSKEATPTRNTTSNPEASKESPLASKPEKNVEGFAAEQDEFNTAAKSEEPQIPSQPLPDLTRGIPSTLDFELNEAQRKADAADGINITEDASQGGEGGSGGKRPRGELPASAYVSSSEKKRLRVANYMYAAFATFAALSYTYLGRNWESEAEENSHFDAPSGWSLTLMWARAKARLSGQLSYYQEPAFRKLLPDPDPMFERPFTLVLSLEDLLVHSEWSREHGWRMAKRPGVDYFLRYLSQYYELVVFTSAPWAMGDPVIKKLDPYHIITWPLFREATNYKSGEYVKDLSYLNRDLSKVIIIDTKEGHVREQPENAIILPKWTGSAADTGGRDLVALIPFLEYIATMGTPDVRKALESFKGTHIPTEFAAREAVARKKFQAHMAEEAKRKPRSGLGFLSGALGANKPMMAYTDGEQSPAEAFAQGKMLQDIARERGQKNYEALEKMIREEGDKWLKDEAAQEEAAKQEMMKGMKGSLTGFLKPSGSE